MIEPIGDYVFLVFDKEKETKSGIVLSDVSKQKPCRAKVVAVGEGKLDRHGNLVKTKLKKGDIVVINPFLPISIKVDGKEYFVMRENEIFAKI